MAYYRNIFEIYLFNTVCLLIRESAYSWNATLFIKIQDHKVKKTRNALIKNFFLNINNIFFLFKNCYNHTCAFMLHNSHLDLFKTVMVVKTIISICNVYSKSFKIFCKNLSQIYLIINGFNLNLFLLQSATLCLQLPIE